MSLLINGFWVKLKGSDLIFCEDPSSVHDRKEISFSVQEEIDRDPNTSQERCYLSGRTRNWPDSFKCVSPAEKDWSFRMILNLKNLNQDIENLHLKMDYLNNAIVLRKRDCFYASLDLKDTIQWEFTQVSQNSLGLCFMTVILNLWCCLWQCYIFTKLLNPAVSHLWSLRLHCSDLYWQLLAVSWCFHGMSGGSFQGLWSFGYSGIYDSSYQVGFQTTTIEFPAWLSHVGLFDFS